MNAPEYQKNNIGREVIPLKLTNQTNMKKLFYYLVGTTSPLDPAHNWYYLSDTEGNVTRCEPGEGETSYCVPMLADQNIKLPRLSGMRLYFSDTPLKVAVSDHGIPSSPAGWTKGSNYDAVFDWIELTWEVNSPTDMTLGGNTTQVDMFGLPFALQLSGFDPYGKPLSQQGGFTKAGLRSKIMDAMKAAASPWNALVIRSQEAGMDSRVLAPYHGMELDTFPADQLKSYIDDVWKAYTTKTLVAHAENVEFSGRVVDGKLVFTPAGGGGTITFPKPDTRTVYMSGPKPTGVGEGDAGKAGVIRAALQAGFMRSSLLVNDQLPACDTSQYYQNEPINVYARTFHEYGADGGAYAFGFDDVCSKSSFIIVHNPTSAEVTLLGF